MNYKEIIDEIEPELDKAIDFLDGELSKIRTGRLSTSLIEDLIVDCFGQKLPLKQLAAISISESRQIVIQPWDESYIPAIEKAIREGKVGASPVVDKNIIRIPFPSLSEEYRKDLLKVLSEKKENTRRTIRHWREDAWKRLQNGFKDGEVSEDDKFDGKDKLQKLVDEYNKKVEEKVEKKRKEIEL